MLKEEELFLIRELSSQNLSISEISRQTGFDRKTVRKYLKMKTLPGPQKRPGRKSKLDPFKPCILEKLKEGPYTAARLYREIKEMGFDGGKTIVKEFIKEVRPKQGVPAVLRYETKPGIQAQVDWGELGTIEVDGKLKKLFCFNMILGYSRMRLKEVRPKQGVPAVLRYETKPGIQAQVDWGELGTIEVDGKLKKLFCFNMILGYSRMRLKEVRPKQGVPAVLRYETKPGIQAQVDWGELGTIEVDGKLKKLFCFNMILGYSRMRLKEVRPKQGVPAVLRYETKPGIQAQVDWGELGTIEVDGKLKKLFCFNMILGYSRMRCVEFTLSMDTPTLIQCHLNAFEYFGGYTQEILYDNMKQVVIKRALKVSDSEWNSQYEDFFKYYGFIPRLCRPYRPQTKGKIENTVGYVKRDFFLGRRFTSLEDLNAQVHKWLERVNSTVHGTTYQSILLKLSGKLLLSTQFAFCLIS